MVIYMKYVHIFEIFPCEKYMNSAFEVALSCHMKIAILFFKLTNNILDLDMYNYYIEVYTGKLWNF